MGVAGARVPPGRAEASRSPGEADGRDGKHRREVNVLAGSIVAQGKIELIECEEPRLGPADAGDGPGEIIFEPRFGCLCGSDLPYFAARQPSYPLQTGLSLHEMVGTVVASSGCKFRAGDQVLAVPVNQVGLFQRFRVGAERAIPLDPRQPPEVAMLAQPLGTVLFALKKVGSLLDADVAVVGQGPIGQLFCAALRNLGARQIIALDRVPGRLEQSPRQGATATIDPTRQDAAAEVARLTGGAMADLVVEAVGHQDQALDLCADLCRPAGRILYFGVPPETLEQVAWRKIFLKNLTVTTSVHPDFVRDFPLAMRWVSEGRLDVAPLITHRFPLREIQKAFETFRDRSGGALKVVIDFPAR